MQVRTWNRKSLTGHLLKTDEPKVSYWRIKSKYYFRHCFAYGNPPTSFDDNPLRLAEFPIESGSPFLGFD